MVNRRQGCAWWGCAALGLLLLTGCAANGAPRTAAAEAWGTWGVALEISAATYEEAMIGVGRASSAGLITQEQLGQLRDAGKAVELSLKAAREALATYGEAMAAGHEAPSPKALVLAAHAQIFDLLQLAAKYGVKYGGAA